MLTDLENNPELISQLGLENYRAILEATETLDFAAVSMKLETFGAFPRAEHDGRTLLQSEARGDPAAEIPLKRGMISKLREWLVGRDAMLITTAAYSFERDLGAGFETNQTIDLIPTFVAFLRQMARRGFLVVMRQLRKEIAALSLGVVEEAQSDKLGMKNDLARRMLVLERPSREVENPDAADLFHVVGLGGCELFESPALPERQDGEPIGAVFENLRARFGRQSVATAVRAFDVRAALKERRAKDGGDILAVEGLPLSDAL